jgi:hypothetical protein
MMKRKLLLGGAIAVVTVALGAGIVYAATSGNDSGGTAAGSSTTRPHSSTTTTWDTRPPASSTTTAPGSAAPGAAAVGAVTTPSPAGAAASPAVSPTTEPAIDPSTPPDPADAYQPVPLPAGLAATITRCAWSASNGGELIADGTLTNNAGEDDVWLISAVWLQHNQTQDEDFALQSNVINLAVGQSTTWHLTTSATSAPPTLSCALEVE